MLDKETIMDRINLIKKSKKRLNDFQKMSVKEFKDSGDNYAIAEHHLRISIEAVLDIGRHVCIQKNLGQPKDYTEIFDILGDNYILNPEFAEKIRGMAGYRNRLVHMYNKITSQELYQIIKERLEDFDIFIKQIMKNIDFN